ncbi:hypothetical protein H0H81_012309 [Sphagnurus paluster]|uniref:Uncharacterized protein n=1 Tax=Sphagnurus paluster TaxID=117069 RepID=A0A9P7K6V3_9AGAR|nr:hypothetical protein H0H81_012309 [Sphagnurus paluster]
MCRVSTPETSLRQEWSLTPGKGNRLILANTEELHERIEDLCARNKQLETALSALQQSVSDQPHPLLQNGSLLHTPPVLPVLTDRNTPGASSTHTCSEEPEKASQSTPADEECLVDSFEHQQLRTPIPPQRLSKKFIEACWPETCAADPALGEEIFGLLPPLSEAIRLCEIYQEHGKYL